MLSPKLYKNSEKYNFFMKLLGYEASIDRLLQTLEVDCPVDCRILDAGCGTGFLGLHFLERFPDATLLATDLESNFLDATIGNADRRSIDRSRISTGVANISSPKEMVTRDGQSKTLDDASFHLISMGAVVGYADDTEASLHQLIDLLIPGGWLINVEMSESLTGSFVSRRYHYDNIKLHRMQDVLRQTGCEVQRIPLRLRHLPAKLTRTAIVARRPE